MYNKIVAYRLGDNSWQGKTYMSMADIVEKGYVRVIPAYSYDRNFGYEYSSEKTICIPLHNIVSVED
jgi:hypothetical protein